MSYDTRNTHPNKGIRAIIYPADTSDKEILDHKEKGIYIRAKDYKAPKYTKVANNGVAKQKKVEHQIITHDNVEMHYSDLPDCKILYAGEIWLIVDAEPDDMNIQKGLRKNRISTSTIISIRQ